MQLRIFDTQLCAKGMKNICEHWHILVSSLSQCGPFYVFVLIAFNRVVLLLDGIPEVIPSGAAKNSEPVLSSFYSQYVSHQSLTWGAALRRVKTISSRLKNS